VNPRVAPPSVEAGAKAVFGVTEEPGRGGWLTPDGSLLDFERLGLGSGGLDHSWLGDAGFWDQIPVPPLVTAIATQSGESSYFVQALWEGLGRWTFQDGGLWVEAARGFTPAQITRIRTVGLRGDCLRCGLDLFPGPAGGRRWSRVAEAPNWLSLGRMLRDFRVASARRQSEWRRWAAERGIGAAAVAERGLGG